MTITTDDHTLTINRSTAGATGVGVAAAATRMAVTIASLTGGGCENGEADSDCQEGDEFFHSGGLVLIRCRIMAVCSSDATLLELFSSSTNILQMIKMIFVGTFMLYSALFRTVT